MKINITLKYIKYPNGLYATSTLLYTATLYSTENKADFIARYVCTNSYD